MSSSATSYVNAKVVEVVAAAASYVAYLSVAPVSSRMRGVPVTTMSSSNVTSMRMLSPIPYVPLEVVGATLSTLGRPLSILMRLECPREPGAPCAASVRSVARFPAPSSMIPCRAPVPL